MLKRIEKNGVLYSIIISGRFTSAEKYNFITPETSSLQVGNNYYRKGDVIRNHIHIPCTRTIANAEEIILVKKGKTHVRIFDENKTVIAEEDLQAGDVLYLARGGHGFDILEDTEIFEVKQGPYLSKEKDKELF